MALDEKTFKRIEGLSEEGNRLVLKDRLDEAIEKYKEALDLIPSQTDECETSSWLQASIGDTLFLKNDYEAAIDSLLDAANCWEQVDNAFIYLRLGQSYYEVHNMEKSRENLLKAYMLEDKEIFDGEEDKYFDLIKPFI